MENVNWARVAGTVILVVLVSLVFLVAFWRW